MEQFLHKKCSNLFLSSQKYILCAQEGDKIKNHKTQIRIERTKSKKPKAFSFLHPKTQNVENNIELHLLIRCDTNRMSLYVSVCASGAFSENMSQGMVPVSDIKV